MKKQIAEKNIKLQKRINTISGVVFLLPVITLLYKYTGMSTVEIIIISNVATIGIWLFELPTSVLADTLGRRTSMIASIVANFLGTLCIFLFPTYYGFIIASIFSALYASFWSGTGQAFLEENLSILGRKKEYGKVIGGFMFWENAVQIFTPLIASLILKYLGDSGYTILAGLDLFFATLLIPLTWQLKDQTTVIIGKFSEIRQRNIDTAKEAISNVFGDKKSKLLLLYRTLGNNIAYFPLLILPILVDSGMQEWLGGFIIAISAIGLGLGLKLNEPFAKKYSYIHSWLFSHGVQGLLMLVCGLLLGGSWYIIAVIYILFYTLDGFRRPSRNHILVHNSKGGAIATTRSIIFSIFALRATLGKQLLGFLSIKYALIILGLFLIIVTLLMYKPMQLLED